MNVDSNLKSCGYYFSKWLNSWLSPGGWKIFHRFTYAGNIYCIYIQHKRLLFKSNSVCVCVCVCVYIYTHTHTITFEKKPLMLNKAAIRSTVKIAVLWNIINLNKNYFDLFLWWKAEFSASLLQSSASHDPSEIILIWCLRNISYHYKCWKLLHCLIFLWKQE